MKINYEMSVEEIVNTVLKSAKYQQVALCFDANSDLDLVDKINSLLKKEVVLFNYNLDNFANLNDVINDSIRCVISLTSFNNYMRLRELNSSNYLLIDIVIDDFICPHIVNQKVDSVVFIKPQMLNNLTDVIFIFANLVEARFQSILQARNYGQEEKRLKFLLDNFNAETIDCEKFIAFASEQVFQLDFSPCTQFDNLTELTFYFYSIIISYKFFFLQFEQESFKMLDVYKYYQNDYKQINLSYKILFDERLNFMLKTNYINMLEFIELFLNKINFKLLKKQNKIKTLNILKILKNNIKALNSDNLLKIVYLYGIFEAI